MDKLTDLALMVDLPGGRERDEAEFRRLFATAKLTVRRIVPTRSPYKIMEVMPAQPLGTLGQTWTNFEDLGHFR